MERNALLVLLALGGLAILWRLFRLPPAFEIAIRDGKAELQKGVASDRFLHEFELVCQTWGIAAGTIRGVRAGGGHISLRFSRDISPEHHQRFCNVFHST